MKVNEIMSRDVTPCGPETDLATASMIMWDHDCGSVPVVDDNGRVCGIITDRDICMAVATRRQTATEITASEVISGRVFACHVDADVKEALAVMQRQKVRRLPVVEDAGHLVGMLSINDIVLHSKKGDSKTNKHVSHKDVMTTLKAICEHRSPTPEEVPAATDAPVESPF
jgi:CBS-domain-containing membrane protein